MARPHDQGNEMSSESTYSKGSDLPPLKPGLLRLYSMRFCPFAERTRLVLNYLEVPHEIINVDLRHKPDWLFQKNPFGLVPIIELDGKIIYESHICNEFLDEVYGGNKLLTKDPYERAHQKMLLEQFTRVPVAYYDALMSIKNDELPSKVDKLESTLKPFENAINGKFFGGDAPNFVDFGIWPWFERLPLFAKYKGVDVLRRKSLFPKLLKWINEMETLPAVKSCLMPIETMAKFAIQYYSPFVPNPNFDLGLTT